MGEAIYDDLVGPDRPVRVYAPVGPHETLLAYLVRRLLENGANSSFVNQVVDETIPLDVLLADPVAAVRASGGPPHPGLVRPPDLFPDRANSRGFDLASEAALAEFGSAVVGPGDHVMAGLADDGGQPVRNPADPTDIVGHVAETRPEAVAGAVRRARDARPGWSSLPAVDRARRLDLWADALESDRLAMYSLLMREAGKTARNAVGEVREAVDFCRYYAAQIREAAPESRPLGVVACISPWNFPLAIFTGQVAAALAAGNTVLAKPAEQTPLVAARAVRLAHASGIAPDAIQLLPGPGETVGAVLVADAAVAGVVFTGSTAVAKAIERTLAGRAGDPVLIAETGGLNAMIVDSSALPEQVVVDVLESAFDSAGQRCSALRILCLQEEIADHLLSMLEGAVRELRVGSPLDLSTDIGPVIDAEARAALESHLDRMRAEGFRVVQPAQLAATTRGTFVSPALVEIPSLDAVTREVFGPILHVLRFRAEAIPELVAKLNATGYGLTHGLHTRIDETIDAVTGAVRAGNVYVNRNIVGAVVGSQPFGGEGLSGTGPKAGGPLYLPRLMRGAAPSLPIRNGEPPPALAALRSWAEQAPGIDAAERSALGLVLDEMIAAPVAIGEPVTLPGPTGELNTWTLHPRGTVACRAANVAGLVAQAAAALAVANGVILPATDAGRGVLAVLPPRSGRIGQAGQAGQAEADEAAPGPDAILADLPSDEVVSLRTGLAAREGAIVPIIVPEGPFRYPLWRLVTERTLSVNTAAAGGNAALLALSEGQASA